MAVGHAQKGGRRGKCKAINHQRPGKLGASLRKEGDEDAVPGEKNTSMSQVWDCKFLDILEAE